MTFSSIEKQPKERNKAIKSLFAKLFQGFSKGKKSNKDSISRWYLFLSGIRKMENGIVEFFKKGRSQVLLDFFRKNSAVMVVILVTILVTAGNARSGDGENGFLYGFFSESQSNEERIQKRVENELVEKNIASASLEVSLEETTQEEDLEALMLKDSELMENQTQYQVLTATTPNAEELLSEGADVAVYEVQEGDTVGSIAQNFGVTANTILWANDIDDPDMIMPGDKIFVLPTTGVKHVVQNGDTIGKIAKKYEADEEKIIAFNDLPADGSLQEGDELIIPDGRIEEPTPTPGGLNEREYYSSGVAESTKRAPSIIDRNPKGGHIFPYGYCTWYVAQHKYVPWGGNAGTWLYHAKAYGAKTGKKPKEGAIIVTSESWYGHVGIVTKVKGDQITIKEMNYKGWAKVSTRTISAKSRVIKGYIY